MEILALPIIIIFVIWLQKYIFARYVFNDLSYTCNFSVPEAFEGDEITLTEVVHNNKLMPLFWLKAEIYTSRWLAFADTRSVIAQDSRFVSSGYSLKNYQKTTRIWKVKCLKRGVYTTENVTLVSGDIFGLHSRSLPVRVGAKLVVFPDIVCLEDILVPPMHIQGDIICRRWIIDDPFIVSGAREYCPGDPMNKIHWQATARQGTLMVRKNDYTGQQNLQLVLNIQSMEYEPDKVIYKEISELGIKIAATILNMTVNSGMEVGFASNGCLPGSCRHGIITNRASGALHLKELLTILSELELEKAVEFEDYLENVSTYSDDSDVIVITAYLNDTLCTRINNLKLRCNTVKVILLDRDRNSSSLDQDIELYLADM